MGLLGKGANSTNYYDQIAGAAEQGGKVGARYGRMFSDARHEGFMQKDQESQILRRNAARDAFGTAWQSGDPKAIERVMAQFPEFAKQAQDFIGIRDDQHRKDVGSLMMRLNGLANTGDGAGIAALVDQSGSLLDEHTGQQLKKMASLLGDPQKGEAAKSFLDRYTNAMAVSTVSPLEAIRHVTDEQRLAQQYQLGTQRINLQSQLGAQRNQLGWARLNQTGEYRQQMLNRGTPAEREWAFFNGLAPEDQQKYLNMKRGPGSGGSGGVMQGLQTVQLSNGQTLKIDPKVHGAGANAFYQGQDASGNLINVPVNSVVTPISSSEQAGQTALSQDLDTLLNSSPEDREHITGYARGGGTGSMPFGADTYTGYKGGTARDIYNAANRIQGNMQNKGIAAAKSMGASGINTATEAKMYFQSMPQLDYSSPQSLIDSAGKIKEYTTSFNQEHGVKYGKGGDNVTKKMSDKELLEGL